MSRRQVPHTSIDGITICLLRRLIVFAHALDSGASRARIADPANSLRLPPFHPQCLQCRRAHVRVIEDRSRDLIVAGLVAGLVVGLVVGLLVGPFLPPAANLGHGPIRRCLQHPNYYPRADATKRLSRRAAHH